VDELPLWVVKRSGEREPFDRSKIVVGVRAATKNRPVTEDQMIELAQQVEDALRERGNEPTSQQVGLAVLEHLKALDDVAYVRFASVYRRFEEATDFVQEVKKLEATK